MAVALGGVSAYYGWQTVAKNISDVMPLTLNADQAMKLVGHGELNVLVGEFGKAILQKNPTPLEAQAVLVATWENVLRNARFSIPGQYEGMGKSQSQT